MLQDTDAGAGFLHGGDVPLAAVLRGAGWDGGSGGWSDEVVAVPVGGDGGGGVVDGYRAVVEAVLGTEAEDAAVDLTRGLQIRAFIADPGVVAEGVAGGQLFRQVGFEGNLLQVMICNPRPYFSM